MRLPPETSAPSVPAIFSGWRYRALLWSVALAALGYLLFAIWSGWRDVLHAVMRVGVEGMVFALALSLVNIGLRFFRWELYLKHLHHNINWKTSLNIYLSGFALSTTPGKTGEFFRCILLIPKGLPYRHGLAAFISERLSDLMALIVICLIGMTVYPKASTLVTVGAITVTILYMMIASESFLRLLQGGTRLSKWLSNYFFHVSEIGFQCRRCNAPSALIPATVLSFLAWAAEAWAFHLILVWMNIDVSLPLAAFIYSVSMLAGMMSFVPGGLGGAEAVMVGLLVWSGTGKPEAVAATVLCRLATLWFGVLIGVVSLSAHRHKQGPALAEQRCNTVDVK